MGYYYCSLKNSDYFSTPRCFRIMLTMMGKPWPISLLVLGWVSDLLTTKTVTEIWVTKFSSSLSSLRANERIVTALRSTRNSSELDLLKDFNDDDRHVHSLFLSDWEKSWEQIYLESSSSTWEVMRSSLNWIVELESHRVRFIGSPQV